MLCHLELRIFVSPLGWRESELIRRLRTSIPQCGRRPMGRVEDKVWNSRAVLWRAGKKKPKNTPFPDAQGESGQSAESAWQAWTLRHAQPEIISPPGRVARAGVPRRSWSEPWSRLERSLSGRCAGPFFGAWFSLRGPSSLSFRRIWVACGWLSAPAASCGFASPSAGRRDLEIQRRSFGRGVFPVPAASFHVLSPEASLRLPGHSSLPR
jgi:hypothetical protein